MRNIECNALKWIGVFLLAVGLFAGTAQAEDEAWVYGKWELIYDPDGAEKDWLEFLPNGDVYNIAPDGKKVQGFYQVTSKDVKAVFTENDRDVLATFHFDAQRRLLKIVTSETGEESVYRKIGE